MATTGRSPNYPSLTLREAIERIKKVYAAQHHYPATKEVVAQNLGYSGINGKSLALIGALKRYALLQADGENLRVTDDAISILNLPEDNPERAAALRSAAFATPVFAQLYETYGDKRVADAVLRHDLRKRKFLEKAADEVIRIYRDNLELVTQETPGYNADDSGGGGQKPEERPLMQPTPQGQTPQKPPVGSAPTDRQPPATGQRIHEFSFPLSFQRDIKAVITIYGEKLKRRDLEFLKRKVGDLLEGFEDEEPEPMKAEPEQPKRPEPVPSITEQIDAAFSEE